MNFEKRKQVLALLFLLCFSGVTFGYVDIKQYMGTAYEPLASYSPTTILDIMIPLLTLSDFRKWGDPSLTSGGGAAVLLGMLARLYNQFNIFCIPTAEAGKLMESATGLCLGHILSCPLGKGQSNPSSDGGHSQSGSVQYTSTPSYFPYSYLQWGDSFSERRQPPDSLYHSYKHSFCQLCNKPVCKECTCEACKGVPMLSTPVLNLMLDSRAVQVWRVWESSISATTEIHYSADDYYYLQVLYDVMLYRHFREAGVGHTCAGGCNIMLSGERLPMQDLILFVLSADPNGSIIAWTNTDPDSSEFKIVDMDALIWLWDWCKNNWCKHKKSATNKKSVLEALRRCVYTGTLKLISEEDVPTTVSSVPEVSILPNENSQSCTATSQACKAKRKIKNVYVYSFNPDNKEVQSVVQFADSFSQYTPQ